MRHPRTAGLVLACLLVSAGAADAIDQPITAGRLQLRTLSSGKQKLVFKSKDPTALLPVLGGSDDPRTAGLVVEILSPGSSVARMVAPASGATPGWSSKLAQFKFKRDALSATVTPVKAVVMRLGRKITLTADATGLAMTAPLGRVGIRLVTGSIRNCALVVGAAVLDDVPGKFIGKDAPPPADCSSSTMTGLAPTCGDGEVNQSTEQCDGSDRGICGDFQLDCRLPGVVGECQCCSNGGAFANIAGCCNPSSIMITVPTNFAYCIATRCDPPYPCDAGDQCQPDGSCCALAAGACQLTSPYSIALNPCCSGLVCQAPFVSGGFQGYACCVPDAAACTVDADCCSQHCQSGACAP